MYPCHEPMHAVNMATLVLTVYAYGYFGLAVAAIFEFILSVQFWF